MKKIYILFILLFAFSQVMLGQGTEDFTNSNATSTYANSSFVGNNSITWTYVASRDGNGDANSSGITLPALMLRRSSNSSKVTSSTISGGIADFSVKLYKGFTGSGNRQVELFINGVSKGTSTTFDDFNEHVFSVSGINESGDIVIEIRNITSKQVIVDDIVWTAYAGSGPSNPTAFSASAGSTPNDLDLSWTQNGSSDNVMVAYNTTNTFGTPTDGSAYTVGNTIAGGGEVIYNGSGASHNQSGLDENTTYFYKAWSVDGSTDYSSGVETNGLTTKSEPSAYPTGFTATSSSSSRINLSWTDAIAGSGLDNAPDGYLIRANKTGTFTAPVDGTDEADATDTNGGTVKVSQGTEAYSWIGLDASTQYYFKVWSYTNSGSHINYKTDGAVPTANATTGVAAAVPDLIITEIMQNPSAVGDNSGEWFEIYNNEDSDVDINGYTIKDDGTNTHTISSSVVISSKDFVVLGNNADAGTNGGLTVDYVYSSFSLANGDDEVVLVYTDGTTEVDRVNYDGGPNFPDPNGASMILTNLATDNNVGANWGTSTLREGSWGIGGAGDKGSPGEIGSEVVLPVELTSFTATNVDGGVMLNWTTATEVNNYGFEVEASTSSATEWETVGFVNGHGNSNSPKEYSYFVNSGATSFRLKQIDNDGKFEYSDVVTVSGILAKTELYQNHPNPFNPSTQINFVLANAGLVNISVYNALGQKVTELVNTNMNAGNHNVEFNANNFASGFYFYRLETSSFSQTRKMLLIK